MAEQRIAQRSKARHAKQGTAKQSILAPTQDSKAKQCQQAAALAEQSRAERHTHTT